MTAECVTVVAAAAAAAAVNAETEVARAHV